MAQIGLDALLTPVSPEAPAGPDLSYDSARQTIEAAFEPGAGDVDWDATGDQIVAQAAQTRDVWLAVYLARAGARSGQLDQVEDGVALLAGYFDKFWDTAYPSVEEYGIEGRKGACESLVRIGEFLAPLRRAPLLVHPRLGAFSGEDFERFSTQGAEAEGYGTFRAAVADTPVDRLDAVAGQLDRIRETFEQADAILSAEAEQVGQAGTNFSATYQTLETMTAAVRTYVGEDDAPAESKQPSAPMESAPARSDSVSGPIRIQSRQDAARALDAISEYYRNAEPSSPVPVAIGRIKAWIAMDFVEILNDIAPGSLSEALTVLRARPVDQGGSDMM